MSQINNTFKIAKLIFNFPNKTFHLRKIAKETKLSTTTVSNVIELLKNILIIEKTEITTNIKANLDKYTEYKRIFNIYQIRILIDKLKHFSDTIVLFGSYSRGEDIEESDIDLLVITNEKFEISTEIFEKELKRKINLHILSNLKNSSNEFKNAIANGIVLHGYLKLL